MKPISRLEDKRMDIQAALAQDKVLAALDSISVKLIKSEAEREALRRELDTTKSTAQSLERSMLAASDTMNETKERLDNALRDLDLSKARQERLDEKLRDASMTMTQLTRKLEAEEKRRLRLYRRMERLESASKQAQEALQSKAMVLLTDRTLAIDSGRPMLNAFDDDADDTRIFNHQPAHTVYEPVFIPSPADKNTTPEKPDPAFRLPWLVFALLAVLLVVLGWQAALLIKPNAQTNTAAQPATPKPASLIQLEPHNPTPALEADADLPADFKPLEQQALFTNNAKAQHDLAALYVSGNSGLARNYNRALALFKMAAEGGVTNAAYNLGVMAHQGLGVPQNTMAAYAWYLKAGLSEHPEALYNLGIARIEGKTATYNPQLAAWYFAHAALNGVGEAAYNLGLILENGLLGEQRSDLAYQWYSLGADLNHADSRRMQETLTEKLGATVDQLAGLSDTVRQIKNLPFTERGEATDTAIKALDDTNRFIMDRSQLITSELQTALTGLRLYTGPVDGSSAPALQNAVKLYRTKYGMGLESNTINTELLQHVLTTLATKS